MKSRHPESDFHGSLALPDPEQPAREAALREAWRLAGLDRLHISFERAMATPNIALALRNVVHARHGIEVQP